MSKIMNNVLEKRNVLGCITNRKCICYGCRNSGICYTSDNTLKKADSVKNSVQNVRTRHDLNTLNFLNIVHNVWSANSNRFYLQLRTSFETACCRDPYKCHLRHQKVVTVEVSHAQTKILNFLMEEQLWEKALSFFGYIVNETNFPNFESFSQLLYFIHSSDSLEMKSIAGQMAHHVLETHPPCAPKMRSFYFQVITKQFSRNIRKGCDNVFNLALSELEDFLTCADEGKCKRFSSFHGTNFLEAVNQDKSVAHNQCFLLKLILEIIECDLIVWLANYNRVSNFSTLNSSPLIVSLLHRPKSSTKESMVYHFKHLTKMYAMSLKHDLLHLSELLSRLLAAIAEAVRVIETNRNDTFYPQYGTATRQMAREIAFVFLDLNPPSYEKYLRWLSLNWLILLVANFLLVDMKQVDQDFPTLETALDYVRSDTQSHHTVFEKNSILLRNRQKKQNINKRNCLGETKLHVACRNNNMGQLMDLLSHPDVNVNIQDNYGWTPLHNAVRYGSIDCVKLLLNWKPYTSSQGAAVNLHAKSLDGITPLMDAVLLDKVEICKILLNYGDYTLLKDTTVDNKVVLDLVQSAKMQRLLKFAEASYVENKQLKFFVKDNFSNLQPVLISSQGVLEMFICFYVQIYRLPEIFEYIKKDCLLTSKCKKSRLQNTDIEKIKFDVIHFSTLKSLAKKENECQMAGLEVLLNKIIY